MNMLYKIVYLLFIISFIIIRVNGNKAKVSQPFSKKSKIGIVGAGPAGLHMASRLIKNGFKNVIVYESTDRVGGKSLSLYLRPDGTPCKRTWSEIKHNIGKPEPNEDLCVPYESGTCFNHNGYLGIFELAKELNIPKNIPPPGRAIFSKEAFGTETTSGELNSYVYYFAAKALKKKNIKPTDFKVGVALMKDIGKYNKMYNNIFGNRRPYSFNPKKPESHHLTLLSMTFEDYLNGMKLDTLTGFLAVAQSAQGYGYLSKVPAYYGLLWTTPELLHGYAQQAVHNGKTLLSKGVRALSWVNRRFGKWVGRVFTSLFTGDFAESVDHTTTMWPSGFQSIWEELKRKYNINVKFNVKIHEIDRHLEDDSKKVEIKYRVGKRPTGREIVDEVDFLIFGGRIRSAMLGLKGAIAARRKAILARREIRKKLGIEETEKFGWSSWNEASLRFGDSEDRRNGGTSGDNINRNNASHLENVRRRVRSRARATTRRNHRRASSSRATHTSRTATRSRRSSRSHSARFLELFRETIKDSPSPRHRPRSRTRDTLQPGLNHPLNALNNHELDLRDDNSILGDFSHWTLFKKIFKKVTSEELMIFNRMQGTTLTTTVVSSPPVHSYCDTFDPPDKCKSIAYRIDSMRNISNEVDWYADRYDSRIFLGKKGFSSKRQVRMAYQFEYYDAQNIGRSPPFTERPFLVQRLKEQISRHSSTESGRKIKQEEIKVLPQKVNDNSGQFSWPYFDHFDARGIKDLLPWKLWDLQGRNKIWYIGGSASFESVKNVVDHNCLLLQTHMGIVCDYVKKYMSSSVEKEIRELEDYESNLCYKRDKRGRRIIIDCVKQPNGARSPSFPRASLHN